MDATVYNLQSSRRLYWAPEKRVKKRSGRAYWIVRIFGHNTPLEESAVVGKKTGTGAKEFSTEERAQVVADKMNEYWRKMFP